MDNGLARLSDEVTHHLEHQDADDHIRLALEVDQDPRIEQVWVQHEFGSVPRRRTAITCCSS
jgi:hypothetical protein